MAIIFELFVECETREGAERQARHFEDLSFALPDGSTPAWQCYSEQTYSGTWSVEVSSPQLGEGGGSTVQDALEMSECGIRLYHHLLTAPEFIYAYTGFNPCCPVAELGDFLSEGADGLRSCPFTCVLGDAQAQAVGPLRSFTPFRPGYVWNTYRGEEYRPLGSFDHPELRTLSKQLLPS